MPGFSNLVLYTTLGLLFSSVAYGAPSGKEPCLRLLNKKGVIHPSSESFTVVQAYISDEYGHYYVLNVKSPVPDAVSYYTDLGFSNFEEALTIPTAEAANRRIQKLHPGLNFGVVEVEESTLDEISYMTYLGQGLIPVGIDGQVYHDMVDHVVGYYMLSQTQLWGELTEKIQGLLSEYHRGLENGASTATSLRRLLRINYFLEALSAAMISEYENGPDAYQEHISRSLEMLRRI